MIIWLAIISGMENARFSFQTSIESMIYYEAIYRAR